MSTTASLLSCSKNNGPENPFDDPKNKPPITNNPVDSFGLDNFAGLQRDIFKKTCSNSGCHDGTFEPDFRTIESSYNTMVYQPVIKNNPAGSFLHRVVPGNAQASVLHERVVRDIDGISGIMPLSVDPDSDWPTRKTTYINAIAAWINAGAKDMFGNPPANGPANPRIQGVIFGEQHAQLSFMSGTPPKVVCINQETGVRMELPVQPMLPSLAAMGLFDEQVVFSHTVDLASLPEGKYLIWTPNTPEPAHSWVRSRLSLQQHARKSP
ncbi:MAG: hypothetical protein ACO3GN_03575 [Bacteroidia bacterium]